MVTTGMVQNHEAIQTKYGTVEPVFNDKRELMVAQYVVEPHRNEVAVRTVNLSNEGIGLRRGYLVGELHKVENLVGIVDNEIHLDSISLKPTADPHQTVSILQCETRTKLICTEHLLMPIKPKQIRARYLYI